MPQCMRFVNRRASTAGTAGLLLMSMAAFAQMNTAEIGGIVKDATGLSIPSATVTALNVATQFRFSAVSNDTGQYQLLQLPAGQYALAAGAPGFKQVASGNIVLHAGERLR